MWCELSARGMRLAQAHKLKEGEFVAFCQYCPWVAKEKNAAYGTNCPDCKERLQVVRESESWDYTYRRNQQEGLGE